MENPEEVLQLLERFTKLKQKEIPRELEDYLSFVARTGDTVYRWPIVKHLFREKLVHVITDFHDNTPSIADLPQCPNVDPFNYERMKRTLLERLDAFNSAPFTVQRICELLTEPRKQYTRIDKFMRAVEKNILVVSTQEPGRRRSDSENGDSLDSIVNGDLEVNVDIEMDNEAFGIDVPNTAASATVAPANGEDTISVPPTTPADEKIKDTDSNSDTTNVNRNDDSAAESDSNLEEPTVSITTNGTVADSHVDEKVSPCSDDADDDKTDSKVTDESTIPEEKPDSTQQKAAETDTVESTAAEEEEEATSPSEPSEKQLISELQPAEESHETIDTAKPPSEICPTSDSHSNEADEDSADDGQPQAKLAKLSEETVTEEQVEPKEITQPISTETVDQEKDEVSSGSTTDSGGSSTSVDSESASSNTDNSASSSAEAIESVIPVEESSQQDTKVQAVEVLEQVEPVSETSDAVQAEMVPEIPTTVEVVEPEVPAVNTEEKQIDVVLEPTTSYVAPDEMETASSALIAESVMATDEEETNAVVPMAADVPDATKPDDNAMDVDESSVEPMDQ